MTCKNILVCQTPRVMFHTWEFNFPTWVVVTVPTFSLLLGHKMVFNFQNYQTILSIMEKTRSLKRVAESDSHLKDFKFKKLKSSYSKIEERNLQSQAIPLSLEIEQDMSRQPSTEEMRRVTSQPLLEKSLAIYQDPEALAWSRRFAIKLGNIGFYKIWAFRAIFFRENLQNMGF